LSGVLAVLERHAQHLREVQRFAVRAFFDLMTAAEAVGED
jgi:hypothetical protein